jgi:glycosyltransferase involved in cell wall biosynthesis
VSTNNRVPVFYLNELKHNHLPIIPQNTFFEPSYAIYEYLTEMNYDFAMFGLRGGIGFFSLQAKQTSCNLDNTTILIYADYPTQYLRESQFLWNPRPILDAKLVYAERYCLKSADYAIVSTYELKQWFLEKQWDLPNNCSIISDADTDPDEDAYCPEKAFIPRNVGRHDEIMEKIRSDNPLVSVCIAHYNHHVYLPGLLESLLKTTYSNYEVIVVDDGSSMEETLKVFDELILKYSDKNNWRFFKKKNEYLGKTRNFCAEKANGEYIVFIDADNYAFPNMVEDFVYGVYLSNADCLTCHFHRFFGTVANFNEIKKVDIFAPMGAVLEIGFAENIFGDANCIVKKKILIQSGGFAIERLALDDWEFFARISLQGYSLDVIPKPLFLYRVLDSSMNNSSSIETAYKSQQRIFKTYADYTQNFMWPLINEVTIPLMFKAEIKGLDNISVKERIILVCKLLFPQKSSLGKLIRKVYRVLQKVHQ